MITNFERNVFIWIQLIFFIYRMEIELPPGADFGVEASGERTFC
jgi:hypothetical protein